VAAGDRRLVVGENGRVAVNTAHPDFQARARYTRQGELRPTDRLNAYLATMLALATLPVDDQSTPAHLLHAQAELILSLEASLNAQR